MFNYLTIMHPDIEKNINTPTPSFNERVARNDQEFVNDMKKFSAIPEKPMLDKTLPTEKKKEE